MSLMLPSSILSPPPSHRNSIARVPTLDIAKPSLSEVMPLSGFSVIALPITGCSPERSAGNSYETQSVACKIPVPGMRLMMNLAPSRATYIATPSAKQRHRGRRRSRYAAASSSVKPTSYDVQR